MFLNDYDFELPKSLIATFPSEKRGDARLLVLRSHDKEPIHDHFSNLLNFLRSGDVLVINNTEVMPARLYGYKASGAKVEIFLIKPLKNGLWEAFLKSNKALVPKDEILLNDFKITVEEKIGQNSGIYLISSPKDLFEFIKTFGQMPIPPYLGRASNELDKERYQTVFAAKTDGWGAVAAPTAGLHLTNELMAKLELFGVKIVQITLKVGLGTFLPIKNLNISEHRMHEEFFSMSADAASMLNQARKEGRRIVAMGTTALRTIEHILRTQSEFKEMSAYTDLFITPGFKFLAADALITNFHLPKSTLFLLVCAILGRDRAFSAYLNAIENEYRFFSYGDACFFEIDKGF